MRGGRLFGGGVIDMRVVDGLKSRQLMLALPFWSDSTMLSTPAGAAPLGSSDEMTAFVKAEVEKWRRVIEAAGAKED